MKKNKILYLIVLSVSLIISILSFVICTISNNKAERIAEMSYITSGMDFEEKGDNYLTHM